MNQSSYTEDTLVQQTTADYLKQQLGWESVYAYNNEDFGPDSLLGRASDREVVLTRTLREKLVELNPHLPDEAYDDAVRQITATVTSQTIAAPMLSHCDREAAHPPLTDSATYDARVLCGAGSSLGLW